MWSPRKVHKAMGPSFIRAHPSRPPGEARRQCHVTCSLYYIVVLIQRQVTSDGEAAHTCSPIFLHQLAHHAIHQTIQCPTKFLHAFFERPRSFKFLRTRHETSFNIQDAFKSIRRPCISTLPDKNHMLTFCQWCGDETQIHGLLIFTSHGQLVGRL